MFGPLCRSLDPGKLPESSRMQPGSSMQSASHSPRKIRCGLCRLAGESPLQTSLLTSLVSPCCQNPFDRFDAPLVVLIDARRDAEAAGQTESFEGSHNHTLLQ